MHDFELADFRPQVLQMARNAGRWSREEYTPPSAQIVSGFSPSVAGYHFTQIVLKTLDEGREDSDARETALALAQAMAHGDHDAWINPTLTKPSSVLTRLLRDFPEIAWPLIGNAILADVRFATRMRYILGRPYSFGRGVRPPILDLPEDTLFAWCHANPDGAPTFVAQCVPILSTESGDADGDHLHPVTACLLDEFGERREVQRALESNIHTYSWSGSSAHHYSRYTEPLERLRSHRNPRVRRWAEKMRREVEHCVRRETNRDREREAAGWLP